MKLYKNILIGLLVLALGMGLIAGGDPIATLIIGVVFAIYMWARFAMWDNRPSKWKG